MRYSSLSLCVLIGSSLAHLAWSDARIPETTRNLLLDARISSNIESLDRGLRGSPDHMLFDFQQGAFATASPWHEYGVGFQAQLGIVTEEHPVWWMAEWPEPVQVNLVALSGTYDNQPQPTTAWKIEFRRDGRWMTHARGVGDWYDRGYYLWGGPGTEPLTIVAFRVSVFSRDNQTPIQSVHFPGEPGKSWIVAYRPPIGARIVTAANDAILAAARGASPDNPVWIVPVGPGTNPASAILQARREGFELKDRIRIIGAVNAVNVIQAFPGPEGGVHHRHIQEIGQFLGCHVADRRETLAWNGVALGSVTKPCHGRSQSRPGQDPGGCSEEGTSCGAIVVRVGGGMDGPSAGGGVGISQVGIAIAAIPNSGPVLAATLYRAVIEAKSSVTRDEVFGQDLPDVSTPSNGAHQRSGNREWNAA